MLHDSALYKFIIDIDIRSLMMKCSVLTAKHETSYPAKVSKHEEEELNAEEIRRKKSIAERSVTVFSDKHMWVE